MSLSPPRRWDIFCRVIDNYGDIGVAWRLARQLAAEYGIAVRLWVDQLTPLTALCPQVTSRPEAQHVAGVQIHVLDNERDFPVPAAVVIEAFGCGLPQVYVEAMAARAVKPLWIVLEYLSAESWVAAHHGLPSPHPRLNLPRYFFFPGVAARTGGVLCEADLLSRRDAFDASAKRAWWARWGFTPAPQDALAVSLFAYPHAPVGELIDVCAAGDQPVVLVLPHTPLADRLRESLRGAHARSARVRNVEVRFLPFVPQPEYDALLWACDVNFVRGEDSFARAQWAGKPFVWHIYPQAANAHEVKLHAFLQAFAATLPAPTAAALNDMWLAWNGVADAPCVAEAWPAFCAADAALTQGMRVWRDQLAAIGDLTGNLVKFCTDKV